MLTKKTREAIRILHGIAYGQSCPCLLRTGGGACPVECTDLLDRLCVAGIIRPLTHVEADRCKSYALCMALSEITLYRLLLVIGENINLVRPEADEERIYRHNEYCTGSLKLGVVNHTLRALLCDIRLTDL